ncbi:MAG: phosphoribosyltransferase, partial [Myxococcaceae bacterium]
PRGGVPVAYEVAHALGAPLDVWVVRKVGAPIQPEYGIGAVAENGAVFLDQERMAEVGASEEEIGRVVEQKKKEVQERVLRFRGQRPPPEVRGRTVILVDDGIATGGTVHAALQSLKTLGPRKLVLAVPVAASDALDALRDLVDEVVCIEPTPFLGAIGAWYHDFRQTTDEEVEELLRRARLPPQETPVIDWELPQ